MSSIPTVEATGKERIRLLRRAIELWELMFGDEFSTVDRSLDPISLALRYAGKNLSEAKESLRKLEAAVKQSDS